MSNRFCNQRPRFSLRWMLIAFTVIAVVFYLFFVRPTEIANRFVSFIEQGDSDSAFDLCRDSGAVDWGVDPPTYDAQVVPRDWSDVLAGTRRLVLRVRPGPRNQPRLPPIYLNWEYNGRATPLGVKLDFRNATEFLTKIESSTQ